MEESDHGATISSSVMNLLNNVVGAGLFSLPWCLKESTVITGSILVTFMCLMNISSFMLLADSCDLTKKYSYLELGRSAFGDMFGTIGQITTICYAGGSLVSYSVLAGDCLAGKDTGLLSLFFGEHSELGNGGLVARAISTFGISFVFFLPLCLLRRIDSLKYASFLAFAATMFAGFLVTYEFLDNPPNSREDDESGDEALASSVKWVGFPLGVWEAVPIVNVAFTAHYNGPRFYEELSRRSMNRFQRMVSLALGGALLIYLTVGICGYLTFGKETLGDVLSNFSPTYPLAIGTRVALLVILVAVFPKALHSMRDGLIRLCYKPSKTPPRDTSSSDKSTQQEGGGYTGDTLPLQPYVLMTVTIVFIVALLGAVCTQVEVVLAYKGGIFGTLMVYILPPLIRTAIAEQTLARLKFGQLVSPNALLPPKGFKPLKRGLDISEVAARPNISNHSSKQSNKFKNNKYLHLSQHDSSNDEISQHSNYTLSTERTTQSDFLFDDDVSTLDGSNKNPLISDQDSTHQVNDEKLSSLEESMIHQPRPRHVSSSSEKLFGVITPTGVFEVVKVMFMKSEHWSCAFIFSWGVASGVLSVGITIMKQAGVLS